MIRFLAEVEEFIIVTPEVEWHAVAAPLTLSIGALLLLLAAALLPERPDPRLVGLGTVGVSVVALVANAMLWDRVSTDGASYAFSGTFVLDGVSIFASSAIAIAVLLSASVGTAVLIREKLPVIEFCVILLVCGAGGMLMVHAEDLILLFVGLEILSISMYVLAGFHRSKIRSGEAALKYFVLGAVASAVFLYGVALLYGATGSTNLVEIGPAVNASVSGTGQPDGMLLAALGLIIVGLAFKVAAVPFHMWTPDVYDGAPSPVSGFLASTAKIAAFVALSRIMIEGFDAMQAQWRPLLAIMAVASLVLGSVMACVQRNVKRMLAYSSISHGGFILMAVASLSGSDKAYEGVLIYLATYTFLVIGSFAVVSVVGGVGDDNHDLSDYRGMSRRRPLLAAAFTLFLLAQAGVPLTSGFIGKFAVVRAAVDADLYVVAIIAMVSAAIAAFFYLRLVLTMYGEEPVDLTVGQASSSAHDSSTREGAVAVLTKAERKMDLPIGAPIGVALVLCATATLLFGLAPELIADAARSAVELL